MIIAAGRADEGDPGLGRTVVSLLEDAVRQRPNPRAFNQRDGGGGWRTWSTGQFDTETDWLAAALLGAGLTPGDRVALFTESDMSFVIGDMACLKAGLVDVPVYLTHTDAAIRHILEESGARAVLVTDAELLGRMLVLAADLPDVQLLGVAGEGALEGFSAPAEWQGRRIASWETLYSEGRERLEAEAGLLETARAGITPASLCTIIYTSGTTGTPKGVMLSQENLSSNAIASLTSLPEYREGPEETVLSFLPLSHIFARTLQYGNMWYSSTIHYGSPFTVAEDLKEVKPTFMAAVPRVIEKSWEKMEGTLDSLSGFRHRLYARALAFARAYDVTEPARGVAALERAFLDRLVYSRWREALGGNLRLIIVGGAALRPELAHILGAAGLEVLEGYGLTETSPVMTFNRPGRNRPGTVGEPIPGTEAAVDDEGEILARGPHVMLGYWRNEEETARVIDEDGWFHTGDLGRLEDGYLSVTGRLKYLFKLSTGKYVTPEPLAERLEGEPLVDTAIIAGSGQRYCTALIFLSAEALQERYGRADASVLGEGTLEERLLEALRKANAGMPHWSTVKRAALVTETLTMESGDVTPKLSVRRERVTERYRGVLTALHEGQAAPEGVLFLDV